MNTKPVGKNDSILKNTSLNESNAQFIDFKLEDNFAVTGSPTKEDHLKRTCLIKNSRNDRLCPDVEEDTNNNNYQKAFQERNERMKTSTNIQKLERKRVLDRIKAINDPSSELFWQRRKAEK